MVIANTWPYLFLGTCLLPWAWFSFLETYCQPFQQTCGNVTIAILSTNRVVLTNPCLEVVCVGGYMRTKEVRIKSTFNSSESTFHKTGSKFYIEQQTVTVQINKFQKKINLSKLFKIPSPCKEATDQIGQFYLLEAFRVLIICFLIWTLYIQICSV